MKDAYTECEDVDVLLVAGIQGSGKSTLTTARFRDRCRTNLDEVRYFHRRLTSGQPWRPSDWNREFEPLILVLEEQIIRFHLQRGTRVVIDNTNCTRESRQHYVRIARELGKTIGIIYLDPKLDLCLTRNEARPVTVPEDVIQAFHERKELPDASEGFDRLLVMEQPILPPSARPIPPVASRPRTPMHS